MTYEERRSFAEYGRSSRVFLECKRTSTTVRVLLCEYYCTSTIFEYYCASTTVRVLLYEYYCTSTTVPVLLYQYEYPNIPSISLTICPYLTHTIIPPPHALSRSLSLFEQQFDVSMASL